MFCFSIVTAADKPNVVIIFLDDSGYADFRPFGDPAYPTPNVEKLAADGIRLNQFYVPQAVCSASRSALLSGCYPGRTKVVGAHGPKGRGLDPKFATMAELFKKNDYATAHFGKWHCGDQPETRPLARGFDEHAGLMYSNDMWRFHPKHPKRWGKHPLQFWDNGKVKIQDVSKKDQENLTKWTTENAVDFINRKKETPFFLYVAHPMPHVPVFCSDTFKGKSGTGLYGDVIMELDWSVGEIVKALNKNKLSDKTIIVFSSDNGPWSEYGNHAGTTPFREHKSTSFDGGVRSATVIKYPGHITPGTELAKPFCSVDLMPTLAHLTDTRLPKHPIDGKNLWPLLAGKEGASNPHKYYPLSKGRNLESIVTTDGKWKLHVPHEYRHVDSPGKDGMPGRTSFQKIELSLFDLKNDPVESKNVIKEYPEVADKLMTMFKEHQAKFYSK